MTWQQRLIATVAGIFLLTALAACSPGANTPTASAAMNPFEPTTLGTAAPTVTGNVQRSFTPEELANYDGMNGSAAYVAVNGVVYDVSNVKQWRTGRHEGNVAGIDLTDIIQQSPHGTSILDGLPVVGTYAK